jgi:hypothetical protein
MWNQYFSFEASRASRAKRFGVVGAAIMAVTFSSGLLRGSMPDVQTGTWAPTGSMATARSGSSAVLLPSGDVLVTGGSGAYEGVETVDVFGADGAFSSGASMNEGRVEHAAVLLKDGRVLVVGGRNANGAVNSAEIYSHGAWTMIPGLTDSRWGHTATLLRDGRVLVLGGENAAGALMSVELFDPETGVFAVAGTMASGRKGHATALLSDGRVMIAGGASGDAVLSTTEIFSPETLQCAAGPSLNTPRWGLTATTLLDGRVLFVGGFNGAQNVASAEIYSDVTNAITFTASSTPMVARRNHQAFLLPNNNAVLLVGGVAEAMVDGVLTARATSAAELFLPWLNEVWQTVGMTVARAQAFGAVLSKESYGATPTGEGLVVVAGGAGQPSSEAYRFATIRVDKDDYLPGMKVTASGSGWQPNEEVVLSVRELPAEHASRTVTVVADESGRIVNAFSFDVEEHHLGVRFFLNARGAASQAQTTFTDGSATVTGVVTNSVTGNPIAGATVSCATTGVNPCNNAATTTTAANGSYSLSVNFAGNSSTVRIQAAATGFSTAFVDVAASNVLNPVRDFALVPATSATTLTIAPASGTYGGLAVLSATLTSGSSPVAGKSVAFTLNGTPVGSGTTNASGVASVSNVSLSGINVGSYASAVAATFAGDATLASSSATGSLTVNKASQTITFAAPSSPAAYNATFGVAPTSDSSLPVAVVATGACSIASGTVTMTSGTGTCTLTASQAGNGNYSVAADVVRSVTASKATQTVTFTAPISPAMYYTSFTVTPTSDSTLSVSVDVTGACSIAGTIVSMNSGSGTCTLTAKQPGDDNYSAAADVVHVVVAAKADAVINVTGYTGTYDGVAHGAAGTAVGIEENPTDLAALLHPGDSFTGVPGGTANWTFDGNSNYNAASGTAPIVINKAKATINVVGYTGVYDGNPHGATGTAAGVESTPADLTSLLQFGNSFSSVPGGTANWTFAGNANYEPASGSVEIVLTRAASTTTVTCPDHVTYNGTAQSPCSVSVTGAGNLNLSPAPTYTNNTSAGAATASHTFAGDTNHDGSSDTKNFTIDRAPSTTVLAFEAGPYVYRAIPFSALAQVTGVGGLTQAVTAITYAGDCTNVTLVNGCNGTATYVGDANHLGSTDSKSITITPRMLTITPAGGKVKVLGAEFTAFTGSVVGLQGSDAGNAMYASAGASASAAVGQYDITSAFVFTTGTASNYTLATNTAVKGLWVQYLWDGFLQPINDTAHDEHTIALYSSFKTGQTIPVKFELKNSLGQIVVQNGNPTFQRTGNLGGCGATTLESLTVTVPEDADGLFKLTGSQYNYGWSTKGMTSGLYQIYARLADGTSRSVVICLSR